MGALERAHHQGLEHACGHRHAADNPAHGTATIAGGDHRAGFVGQRGEIRHGKTEQRRDSPGQPERLPGPKQINHRRGAHEEAGSQQRQHALPGDGYVQGHRFGAQVHTDERQRQRTDDEER